MVWQTDSSKDGSVEKVAVTFKCGNRFAISALTLL